MDDHPILVCDEGTLTLVARISVLLELTLVVHHYLEDIDIYVRQIS